MPYPTPRHFTFIPSLPAQLSRSHRPPPMSPQSNPKPPTISHPPTVRATIAAPSDPTRASPNSDKHPPSTSVPWMPLPGLVHSIQTPEQFDRLSQVASQHHKLLVVDFMAAWCRKCLYLLPQLKKVAAGRDDVYFCSVDVNKVRRLPKEFAIEKMPTFVFLKGGERVATLVAGMAPDKAARAIRQSVDQLAALG